MTAVLRFILFFVCLGTCCYTLHKIRKSQMQIGDSLFWILISIALVFLSIFPEIASLFTKLLGIGTTVNFIFLAMIFILLIKVFFLSIKISQMEEKIKNLVQRIAITNNIEEKKVQKITKELCCYKKNLTVKDEELQKTYNYVNENESQDKEDIAKGML